MRDTVRIVPTNIARCSSVSNAPIRRAFLKMRKKASFAAKHRDELWIAVWMYAFVAMYRKQHSRHHKQQFTMQNTHFTSYTNEVRQREGH